MSARPLSHKRLQHQRKIVDYLQDLVKPAKLGVEPGVRAKAIADQTGLSLLVVYDELQSLINDRGLVEVRGFDGRTKPTQLFALRRVKRSET